MDSISGIDIANGNHNSINLDGPPQEQLKQFLEPYTKEELETLLLQYCEENNDASDSLLKKIKSDKKWCKLFVHGLAFTTSNEALEKYYEQYGKVKEAVVLVDKKGNSRGYGFVTFSNADEALNAVKALSTYDVEKKKIDNRVTHCNLAWKGNPKKGWTTGSPNQPLSVQARQEANDRRLFVHSLAWKTDDESLRNAFREYGDLVEAVVIRDKKTGKSKGYGFVTFKHAESARSALMSPTKTIDGRKTRCNYASTRDTKLYADGDSNAGTPEPVDLTGSNGGQSTSNNGDINNHNHPNLINNISRGLTPNTTQGPSFNLNNVAGLNGAFAQSLFPEDFSALAFKGQNSNSMDMYNIRNYQQQQQQQQSSQQQQRPQLANFGSNSSFGGIGSNIFSNMTQGPNGTLVLGHPLSNGFSNTPLSPNKPQQQQSSMMHNTSGPNKPQGIIVHPTTNILPPNTPPMYAHLSSPVKAPSVSSVQSLLTPAPVPLYAFNSRIFNN